LPEPKTQNDDVPIQLQGIKNYVMEQNAVTGRVYIRSSSEGTMVGNIINAFMIEEASVMDSNNDYMASSDPALGGRYQLSGIPEDVSSSSHAPSLRCHL
jgi:hypothetical protein